MSFERLDFNQTDRWGKTQADIRDELLRKDYGFQEFVAFGGIGEGERLETGLEDMSWQILTPDGKVRIYTLGWDSKREAPEGSKGYYYLEQDPLFSQVTLDHMAKTDREYIRARKQLGLPLTDEQEHILRKEGQ